MLLSQLIHPQTTTVKSRIFHESLRQELVFIKKPRAIILSIISIVQIIKKVLSIPSSYLVTISTSWSRARKRVFKRIINKINRSNQGFLLTKRIILFLKGFDDDKQQREEDAYFGISSSSIACCSSSSYYQSFFISFTLAFSTYYVLRWLNPNQTSLN